MNTLTLLHHDAAGARAMSNALFETYAEIYAAKLADPFYSMERFTERFESHTAGRAFELVTGHVHGALAGYSYGAALSPETRWWNGLVTDVPPADIAETGCRTFAVNEIMVAPAWRRRGFARQLHNELLGGRPEERATLLVEAGNEAALAAYTGWGWRELGRLQPFPDAPVYVSMVLPLA